MIPYVFNNKKLLNHILNISKWVIGQKSMWKFGNFNVKWKKIKIMMKIMAFKKN